MGAEVQSAAGRAARTARTGTATRCDRLWRNARLVTLASGYGRAGGERSGSSGRLGNPAAASGEPGTSAVTPAAASSGLATSAAASSGLGISAAASSGLGISAAASSGLGAGGAQAGADRLGLIDDGVVASQDGLIVFAGARGELPPGLEADEVIDCQGRLITPGFIDCHTHLVYAGDRAHEWERRLNGESYEAIARAGGGIAATVRATRVASEASLVREALPRLDALLGEGVTTVEIKSGYGLSLEHERKQLCAARSLAAERDVTVTTTLLGAHALPPEYAGRPDEYVTLVCEHMIPELAAEGLVDAVDAFCERIGFSVDQTRRVFDAAAKHGLRVKLHAEQLSNSHGAALAAAYGALSADHLEHLDDAGVDALARAGTTAVLLPGAFYFTRETQLPPLARLRERGVPIALATDCNPGTSPLSSILLALNLAATLFRMSVDECLIGVTSAAAGALGLAERIGSLVPGKRCDLAIWNVERPAELVYRMGGRPLHARVWGGR